MANIECLTCVIRIYTFRQLENTPTLLVLSVEPLRKSSICGICVDKHTESRSALWLGRVETILPSRSAVHWHFQQLFTYCRQGVRYRLWSWHVISRRYEWLDGTIRHRWRFTYLSYHNNVCTLYSLCHWRVTRALYDIEDTQTRLIWIITDMA